MVSSSNTISSLLNERLLHEAELDRMQYLKNNKESNKEVIDNLSKTAASLPSVLDKETLLDLKNGKYDITLKDYTSLATYSATMSYLYGNKSANSFLTTVNNMLNTDEDSLANSKLFIDAMKKRGASNKTALKMYSAFQSYSLMNTLNNLNNSSFVSAKI